LTVIIRLIILRRHIDSIIKRTTESVMSYYKVHTGIKIYIVIAIMYSYVVL